MLRRWTDHQLAEARRIVAVQASTAPADGDLSPAAALRRHPGLLGASGHRIEAVVTGWPSMMPEPERKPVGRGKP